MANNVGSKENPVFKMGKDCMVFFKLHGIQVAFGSQEIFIPEELLHAHRSFQTYHLAMQDAEYRITMQREVEKK